MLDRYEIGERQTSACAAPTEWLEAMGVADSIRQTFDTLVIHTPHTSVDFKLPWTFSTFDYRQLCGQLWEQCDASSRRPKSIGARPLTFGRSADRTETDRGTISRPHSSSSFGWKRVLAGNEYQPPDAPLSRGLEVHPVAASEAWRSGSTATTSPPGYGWSFPARRGDPYRRRLVRPALPRQGADGAPGRGPRRRGGRGIRATGFRTSSAPPPATASSSSATPPGTACR